MKKSPLAVVRDQFTDKAGLISAVRALATDALWVDRVNDDKGLDRVSNRKLLHLHAVLTQVKNEVGSRSGLIDSLLKMQKREKDESYRARLERFSLPRLWDAYRSSKKREKQSQ